MTAITFVIPAYNAETTLARALDSLLAQDSSDWAAIIIDDGSTDGTFTHAQRYAASDGRFAVITQENRGTGAARNAGIEHVDGGFVALLDADDAVLPNYVSTMRAFLAAHPGFEIYSCNAWVVRSNGERTLYADDPQGRRWVSIGLREFLEGEPYFFAGGALIDANVLRRLGGFRTDIYCEDVDFGRRALAGGASHIFCPKPLVLYYRNVSEQKTSDRTRILQSLVRIDEDLLASGTLGAVETRLVTAALERERAQLSLGGSPEERTWRRLESQTALLRRFIMRVGGARRADAALTVLHRVTRPLRGFRVAAMLRIERYQATCRRKVDDSGPPRA